jgi:hypothetical protein
MRTRTFHQWLDAAFDHPVRKREWYWDEDFENYWDRLKLSDVVTVEYMTCLFLAPDYLNLLLKNLGLGNFLCDGPLIVSGVVEN